MRVRPIARLGLRRPVRLAVSESVVSPLVLGALRPVVVLPESLLSDWSRRGLEMVLPGDDVTVVVELGQPLALEPQLRFAIREGGRTVGAGKVLTILE